MSPAQEPQNGPPVGEEPDLLASLAAGWDDWLGNLPPDDLPPLEWDPFTLDELPPSDLEQALATLDRQIETAQEEMNTADGLRRLDDLLEQRDLLADDLVLQTEPEPVLDWVDARFLGRPDLDAEGAVTGYIVQYMEVYQDPQHAVSGRVLDVGHYDTLEAANKVYGVLQDSIADGTLTPHDLPVLATELAEANGLPPEAWRPATPADHVRYAEQAVGPDPVASDIPPESLAGDPVFAHQLFQAVLADPVQVAQEQARLANEQALTALQGIGLSVQSDFNLARDSVYDAERGERLINGIFQRDPDHPAENCRPLLVSLTTAQDGLGFAAQAVEFGRVGSLAEVQADHDRVQTALEQGGVTAGIAAVEALDTDLAADPTPPAPSTWSREID